MSLASRKPELRLGRFAVALLSILALTISLANRTADLKLSTHTSVESQARKGEVQHRDRDAFVWAPILANSGPFYLAVSAEPIMPEESLVFSEQVDSCLYNRPPPLS
jgi:hypothetical protein